ncbi:MULTISPECIES: DctP family TRAP transporter solute-binding subunit [Thalassospira]|uniref:C4-dicarboxylate ABC transporter substrate-binding protein n=2 Tax=Thalassospira TaxID=168934 RepID=A0ABR4TKS8_9PROT|nr:MULTISPECIES: DctP family TRAP transporter solute-binding subunit [Thalassospira]KEO53729.1 C4-dicarboxylate ABC transporter substrate-binding protein [Thalassospira permensis NBRC 106175]MAB31697.1 C4-dicarboxylate ABC transporter substrate-binding protein [Thalassospira sp.]MDM7975658.1 DctP family TRAP transporter solute-binding subunit [Thalassospira xiamenensis]|tara:strand:- start:144 stop:1199 length:1056 start_codon:yes stop_codon:yes gene_type:complete
MNTMKRFGAFALATAMLASTTSLAYAEPKVLKFAHDNKEDPFENPAHACTAVFANIVEADTNGEIKVEVYPSNQLGSAAEHVQMVRDGLIQATLTSTGAIASYYPRIDVLNLAFAFDSNASTYDVFDGPFGQKLAADIESTLGDVKVLGFPDTGGFFAVTNSKHPIATLEDFKGIRVRTMSLPSHQKIMQSLGAEAYPMAWGEVYAGLQTGVIDGQMNPVPTVTFAKFNEVQGYLTLTNHLFSPYTFMLSKAFWDDLTADQQKIVRYAAQSCVVASRGVSRVIEASDRGLAGLTDKMEITALSAQERQKLKDVTQPVVVKHVQESLGTEGVELLELFQTEVDKANAHRYME